MDATAIASLLRRYPVTLLQQSGNYRTCPARLSFPSLFEKTQFEDGEPKFSCVLLFPRGADLKVLYEAAKQKAVEEWGSKALSMNVHMPFRDQGDKALAGYEKGAVFLTANTKQRPGVVGPNARPIEDQEQIYPGCWVLATIRPFAYDRKAKKGVSFGLQNVMKLADDEPFAGGARADEEFSDITGDMSGDNAFGLPDLG